MQAFERGALPPLDGLWHVWTHVYPLKSGLRVQDTLRKGA